MHYLPTTSYLLQCNPTNTRHTSWLLPVQECRQPMTGGPTTTGNGLSSISYKRSQRQNKNKRSLGTLYLDSRDPDSEKLGLSPTLTCEVTCPSCRLLVFTTDVIDDGRNENGLAQAQAPQRQSSQMPLKSVSPRHYSSDKS